MNNFVVDASLFRANDIRGIAGRDTTPQDEPSSSANSRSNPSLTPLFAYHLGRALGSLLQRNQQSHVWLCRDARLSSPALHAAISEGLLATGCSIIDIGIGPTPLLCHAVATRPAPYESAHSGVMITASHNPAHHNGFKIIVNGKPFFGDDLSRLQVLIEHKDYVEGAGKHVHVNHQPNYLHDFQQKIGHLGGSTVVLDAANGAAGPLAVAALERVGVDVIPLYCDMDGRFPNHSPDTSDPANLRSMQARLQDESATAGIALDGDGDRVVAATEHGDLLNADDLLRIYSQHLLTLSPGAGIVFDIKTSTFLREHIETLGGHPIMTRSGRSFIQTAMFEHQASLAGEFSSHFFFADEWYGTDDGIYAAARLLKICQESGTSLSAFLSQRPASLTTNEIYLPVPDADKFDLVNAFTTSCTYDENITNEANLVTIDGLRIEYPAGWALVRASNTTAAITLRFEADTEKMLESLLSLVRRKLAELSPDLDLSHITR